MVHQFLFFIIELNSDEDEVDESLNFATNEKKKFSFMTTVCYLPFIITVIF